MSAPRASNWRELTDGLIHVWTTPDEARRFAERTHRVTSERSFSDPVSTSGTSERALAAIDLHRLHQASFRGLGPALAASVPG